MLTSLWCFKCSKICAQSVFVALKIDQLDAFIEWLQKQNRYSVNYLKLASVDMPKGSGRKVLHIARHLKNRT